MDKGGSQRLQLAIGWILSMGRGQYITYRHQDLIKSGNSFRGHVLDNAGFIGNPKQHGYGGKSEPGAQVGEGAARLEDTDDSLGRGRSNGAGTTIAKMA
jgi:hypothetical protein